jgi:hypothetical protein
MTVAAEMEKKNADGGSGGSFIGLRRLRGDRRARDGPDDHGGSLEGCGTGQLDVGGSSAPMPLAAEP